MSHHAFASSSRARPSMRRTLVGLKVVRPRCAAGAPPRPRLRSTVPARGEEPGPTTKKRPDPTFTGVPNTDKDTHKKAKADSLLTPVQLYVAEHPGLSTTDLIAGIRQQVEDGKLDLSFQDADVRAAAKLAAEQGLILRNEGGPGRQPSITRSNRRLLAAPTTKYFYLPVPALPAGHHYLNASEELFDPGNTVLEANCQFDVK